MKRVLITGANSYIGMSFETYAKEYYKSCFEIDTLDMQDTNWRKKDFSKYDVVFHVAGIAHADVGNVSEEVKKRYYAVNTDLTIETAKKAKLEGVKQFVFMSSMIIYGESAPYGKNKMITADTEPVPANFYGDSKLQADIGVRKLQDEKFTVSVIRPPMIYGKGSKGNYPILAKMAKKLPVFPNVENQRSMLYIENLCEFLCQVMELQRGGVFFPQNKEYTKTADMVKDIAIVTENNMRVSCLLNPFVWLASKIPGKISGLVNKAFGNSCYDLRMSTYEDINYQKYSLSESIKQTEGKKKKRALIYASVASMIDQFNRDNIKILQEEGYEVDVAANFSFGSSTSQERVNQCRKELEEQSVKVFDISIPRSLFKVADLWKAYKQTKRIVDQGRYDIVHCHSPIGGVICRMACRKYRKKGMSVIYTAHGFHFYKGAPLKNWILFYPIEKICAYFTDTVITINREDYGFARKKMKAQKVEYVPGVGIEVQKFVNEKNLRDLKRRELEIPKDAKLLLSVGELNANKNHEIVIRAIQDMDVYYIIAGQGVLEAHLKNVIETLGMKNRVKLLGFRNDINELCDAADIFVFPSFREGLSVALMEAMASSLPVVCSKIRGNVDLIDSLGGELFDPHSVGDCREAVERILNRSFSDMSSYNLNKSYEYQSERINNKMKAIYSGCMKE